MLTMRKRPLLPMSTFEHWIVKSRLGDLLVRSAVYRPYVYVSYSYVIVSYVVFLKLKDISVDPTRLSSETPSAGCSASVV